MVFHFACILFLAALELCMSSNCTTPPSWLVKYAEFHRKNRDRADSLPTMTYVTNSGNEPGLGDRMRAMMWGLRVAAASKRLLFINMIHPLPLNTVFSPNLIDWQPIAPMGPHFPSNLDGKADVTLMPVHFYYGGGPFPQAHDPLPWSFKGSKEYDVDPSITSKDLHCLFSYLFKPTSKLEDMVNKEHARLFNSSKFAAAHVRSGGFVGEEDTEGFGDTITKILGALHCMKQWNMPMLLVSGNELVRKAISRSYFTDAVKGLTVKVVHTKARVRQEDHWSTFLEIGLMARASCFVRTKSGFGDISRWLSGQTDCVRYIGTGDMAPFGTVSSTECVEDFQSSRRLEEE